MLFSFEDLCDEELLTGVCYWLFAMFDPFKLTVAHDMMFTETLDGNNDMLLITPNELNNSKQKVCTNYKLGVEDILI